MKRPIIGYDTTRAELKLLAEAIWGFKVKAKGANATFYETSLRYSAFWFGISYSSLAYLSPRVSECMHNLDQK